MDERDLRAGDWYIVAGEGPMKLLEVPAPQVTLTCTFETPYGHLWHSFPSQVVRLVDEDFVKVFEQDYLARFGRDPFLEDKKKWFQEMKTWLKTRR
jgi:hypothetical protein